MSKCAINPGLHSITLNSRQLAELWNPIYKVQNTQEQQAILAVKVLSDIGLVYVSAIGDKSQPGRELCDSVSYSSY